MLRNANLEFDAGASVEIESLFEHCTIALGEGTELVVGKSGVLSGCQVKGAGQHHHPREVRRAREPRHRRASRSSS